MIVIDDHLLRDVLAARPLNPVLRRLLRRHEPTTTNLYYHRLCRSVVAARGGALTGSWPDEERRALGRVLVSLPTNIVIVAMDQLAYRMAELAVEHRLSTLGAEAVAAAEHLGAALCVWNGDDGPKIRSAMAALGLDYRAVERPVTGS